MRMKIQCNVCEVAEAKVLCCADEAVLCQACDEKVHAANKLASKHRRVSLCSSSSQMPKCDICQETVGHFFCLEDRALLCRKCDVAIHTVNTIVSSHQRFLLTGVKVGLEPIEHGASSSSGKSHSEKISGKLHSGEKISGKIQSGEKISEVDTRSSSRKGVPMSLAGQGNEVLPVQVGDFEPTMLSFAGGSAAGSMQQWQVDEFLGLNELDQNYVYMDNGSSKADSGQLRDSDYSPILRAAEIELDGEEGLCQVQEASWAVPQITSPPTASGLYWPKNYQPQMDTAAFVPDIYRSPMQNPHHCQRSGAQLKRRMQF